MRMSTLPPSWMSVPRPAMLVAMVTAPGTPAWATMIGLLLVVAGVEDGEDLGLRWRSWRIEAGRRWDGEVVLLQPCLAQHLGELLRFLDRGGADQHRLAARLGSPRSA